MKKLILLFSLTLSQFVFAQKYLDTLYGFKLDNSKLIWQKVYRANNKTKVKFKTSVLTNINKQNLQEYDNLISFEVKGDNIDFKKYGGKWGNTPTFVQYPQNYLVIAEFKDNRYRITVKSVFVDYSTAGLGKTELSEIVIKRSKGKIKNNSLNKKSLKYYDLHFSSIFNIKTKKDDW